MHQNIRIESTVLKKNGMSGAITSIKQRLQTNIRRILSVQFPHSVDCKQLLPEVSYVSNVRCFHKLCQDSGKRLMKFFTNFVFTVYSTASSYTAYKYNGFYMQRVNILR